MFVTIKISPTFKDYFNDLEYQVDVSSYYDIEFYLRSVHTYFGNYIKQIQNGQSQEGFTYLDKNLKVIERQSFPLKKIKDGDIIYLAPVICGGGGKRGFIFAAVAVVALAFMLPAAPMAPGMMTAMYGSVGAAPTTLGGSLLSSMGMAFSGMPSFVQGILGNLALSAIGALFTSKPKGKPIQETKDSGTRSENNMFGSLQNSTTSGTPVSVNYGLMRVAGQFLSGYILSTQHGQSESPTVQAIFDATQTPIANSLGADE